MLHRLKYMVAAAFSAVVLTVAPATAQAVWDAPSFMRPGAPAGLSMGITDAGFGDDLGFLALWRNASAPAGLGFRAGIVEAPNDEIAGIFGIDVSGSLSGPLAPGRPEVMWWSGAGVGLGDQLSASFPLGLVFGWTAQEDGTSFMPYAGGHVVLDVVEGPGDDLDLEGVVDLGLDIGLQRGWMVRFGAALGGREALGIAVHLPHG